MYSALCQALAMPGHHRFFATLLSLLNPFVRSIHLCVVLCCSSSKLTLWLSCLIVCPVLPAGSWQQVHDITCLVRQVAAGVPRALLEHSSRHHPECREVASVFVCWTEQPHMHGPLGECVSKAVSACMLLCASQFGGYLSESGGSGKRLLLFGRVRHHDMHKPRACQQKDQYVSLQLVVS